MFPQDFKKTINAAILSGGKATRFSGFPKGEILINGISIIQNLLNEFRRVQACLDRGEIIVANDLDLYQKYNIPVIKDLRKDCGPLAGIEAALNYYRAGQACMGQACLTRTTLFVPCDLPNITHLEIKTLCDEFLNSDSKIVFATTNNFKDEHPLCVLINNDLLPVISKALDNGVRKVRDLWNLIGAKRIDFKNQNAFLNLNNL